jgi:MSHA biogenesis protein MshL
MIEYHFGSIAPRETLLSAQANKHSWKQLAAGRIGFVLGAALLIAGCGTTLPEDSSPDGRHLQADLAPPAAASEIPGIVTPAPLVPAPQAQAPIELYTVVAQDIPLRDLLFTLSRDAGINIDVHPALDGIVTINAIDQSLPQILERIARQSDIRWNYDESGNLVVAPDSAEWRTYKVDYVNVGRTAETEATISTAIVSAVGGAGGGGAGGGNNNSTSSITQTFSNNFWTTLRTNLANLLGEAGDAGTVSSIVTNPETGLVSVRATNRQHTQIGAYINMVQSRSLQQVLIEATVVEVSLSDDYQGGVDWQLLGRNNGEINFIQSVTSPSLGSSPTNILSIDRSATPDAVDATVAMLSQFGELRVLSSPKIMALNNQTAMLRVVDNEVYFTVDVEPGVISATGPATSPTYTTTVNTVPVGFVMTVTPQVSDNDQVTLNVRPTISRIVGYADDPNPILAEANVENSIPRVQVREFESMLKLYDGQIAILGGLMEDSLSNDSEGLPGLSRLPGVRNLFSNRREVSSKTELIIFIRPVVVRQPSLNGDLSDYSQYLPANGLESSAIVQPGQLPGLSAE